MILIGLVLRQAHFAIIPLNTLLFCLSPLFFSLLFSLVILEQNFSENSFLKFSRLKHFSIFGKYTYFAYCFHYHIFFIVVFILFYIFGEKVLHPGVVITLTEMVLSYGLIFLFGKFSFNYLEKPFMQLKKRFSYIVKEE